MSGGLGIHWFEFLAGGALISGNIFCPNSKSGNNWGNFIFAGSSNYNWVERAIFNYRDRVAHGKYAT